MTRHIPVTVPSVEVQAPPSKSLSHRMLIAAALSGGSCAVSELAFSEDVLATLDCLGALGYPYDRGVDCVRFKGAAVQRTGPVVLDCRESGSTMRFMVPVALSHGGRFVVKGSERLLERGLGEFAAVFEASGITMRREGSAYILEGRLKGGDYSLDCSRSSQFLSGLLMALPLCEGPSTLTLSTGNAGPGTLRLSPLIASASFAGLTREVLAEAGIDIRGENPLQIPGSRTYICRDWTVEGDWTGAAYLDAFNFLPGADVRVTGLNPDSGQGDRRYPALFEALRRDDGPISIEDNIDLGPVLFAAAALCGHGLFTGTSRLRYKESDRVTDMLSELAKFGVRSRVGEDEVEIIAPSLHAPDSVLDTHGDHRIVMALSLLAACFGADISGVEAVRKSFPDFFEIICI